MPILCPNVSFRVQCCHLSDLLLCSPVAHGLKYKHLSVDRAESEKEESLKKYPFRKKERLLKNKSSRPTLRYQHHPATQDVLYVCSQIQSSLVSPVLAAIECREQRPDLGLFLGGLPPQQHPLVPVCRAPRSLGVALLAVAGEDVAVGGREPHSPRAAQPHGLQLGGLGPAAVAAGAEGLLQDRAEGNHGLRA